MKITFIGAGNMAEAIISGIIKNKKVDKKEITVSDISQERLDYMLETFGINASIDNNTAVKGAEVIVLAIKPQAFSKVWDDLHASISPDVLIISIMAGVSSDKIENGTKRRVVRVMPNTPALIGQGVSGVSAGKFASYKDMDIALDLMSACGLALEFSEDKLHAVTALSGSGPAYIFYFIEAMCAAGVELGLTKEDALILAKATAAGASNMAMEANDLPEVLRNRVTSKGGTTAAALDALSEQKVDEAISRAMKAAVIRSKELAK